MQARTVTFKKAVRVWWSFTWRWPVYMIAPVVLTGALFHVIKPSIGFMHYFLPTFTWTVMIVSQWLAMGQVLRKYRDNEYEG